MQTFDSHRTCLSGLSIPVPFERTRANFPLLATDLYRSGNDRGEALVLGATRDLLQDAFALTPNSLSIFGELPKSPEIAPGLERELVKFLGTVRGPDALRELCANFPLHMHSPRRYLGREFHTSPLSVTSEYLRAFSEFKAEAAPISGFLSMYLSLLTDPESPRFPAHPEEPRLIAETIQALNAVGLTVMGRNYLQSLAAHPHYSAHEDVIQEALWTSSNKVPFIDSKTFQSEFERPSGRHFSVYDEALTKTALAAHTANVSEIRQAHPVLTSIAKDIGMTESGIIAIQILSALKQRRISQ